MSYQVTPTKATAIFQLPPAFACAWSPGFDLHVVGSGATEQEAKEALVSNLRTLGVELLDRALEIERGRSGQTVA